MSCPFRPARAWRWGYHACSPFDESTFNPVLSFPLISPRSLSLSLSPSPEAPLSRLRLKWQPDHDHHVKAVDIEDLDGAVIGNGAAQLPIHGRAQVAHAVQVDAEVLHELEPMRL